MKFVVYEVFYSDGKKFPMFESKDRFDCEVWIHNEGSELISVNNRRAFLIVEEVF